ncbi:Argininosuccinate lyase-Arginosuccinase [Moritella viscosa]|nr:Argininosuccinate lyase-Arginosuccinase [Moritella viscosa]
MSSYGSKSPVDEALKSCGLGYSSEVGAVFKAAYDLSKKTGGSDFKASLTENLNTQVMAFATNAEVNKSVDGNALVSLIKSTQECVINSIDAARPKTRSDFVAQCADDLQNKVAGKGKTSPLIKQTFVATKHPDFSDDNLLITALVDHGGSKSYRVLVACNVSDNIYQGLDIIKSQ